MALLNHWKDWPPTHIAVALAWLERKDDQGTDGEGFAPFAGAPGVSENWIGHPPFRPEDVVKLAEEARARDAAQQCE